jgi:hypothetical protein
MIDQEGNLYNGGWANDKMEGEAIYLRKEMCMIEGVWKRGALFKMNKYTSFMTTTE